MSLLTIPGSVQYPLMLTWPERKMLECPERKVEDLYDRILSDQASDEDVNYFKFYLQNIEEEDYPFTLLKDSLTQALNKKTYDFKEIKNLFTKYGIFENQTFYLVYSHIERSERTNQVGKDIFNNAMPIVNETLEIKIDIHLEEQKVQCMNELLIVNNKIIEKMELTLNKAEEELERKLKIIAIVAAGIFITVCVYNFT